MTVKFTFDGDLRITAVDTSRLGDSPTMGDVRDALEEIVTGVFDTALPQAWVDDVRAKTGEFAYGFLWYYAPRMSWGAPFPVTNEAIELLARYNKALAR